MIKHGSSLKNHNGLHMLEGYRHLLLIIRYKHWRYQRGLLITSYIGMYTRSKKGIKTRIETTIDLYGKGNEIIFRHSLCVNSCLVLNGNCCCMCYCHQSMLHQICTSQINNDNIRQGPKIMYGDDNIHLSLFMAKEKVGNLSMYMSSTFQCHSYNGISKSIMGCNVLTPT